MWIATATAITSARTIGDQAAAVHLLLFPFDEASEDALAPSAPDRVHSVNEC